MQKKMIANKPENNEKQSNSVNLWESSKNIFRQIIITAYIFIIKIRLNKYLINWHIKPQNGELRLLLMKYDKRENNRTEQ